MTVRSSRSNRATRRIVGAAASLAIAVALFAATPAGASRLAWKPCEDPAQAGFQCAKLAVPLAYGKPHGKQIRLALIRQRALDGHAEKGALVTNFGGPGGSGLQTLPSYVGGLSTRIRDAFDLVGFDPRGVGESAPIECHSAYDRIFGADPRTATGAAQIVSGFRAVGRECAADAGRRKLSHLGTSIVARDLNRVRAALGERRLTFDGLSYGTRIGAVYADHFPNRIRAFVLDGAMDPRPDFHTLGLDQAQAWEDVLARLLSQCDADAECPLQPNPPAAFDELLARLRQHSMPAPRDPSGQRLTVGWFDRAVTMGMMFVAAQESLEQGIADALATNDGSELLALGHLAVERGPRVYEGNGNEMFAAVNCLDFPDRLSPSAIAADAAQARRYAPRMGAAAVYADEALCSGWRVPPRPVETATGRGAPPILVIGNTGDPSTPYRWSQRLAASLVSARLLTYDGIGHTAYGHIGGNGSACVDRHVDRYLLRRKLPHPGAVCTADVPIPVAAGLSRQPIVP